MITMSKILNELNINMEINHMDIPSALETSIREGKAVIILGAGASLAAQDNKGKPPPSGVGLAAMISDRFLGGKHKNAPLHQVAELAISEADLITVQNFVKSIFDPLLPSEAHKTLASFRWWGLATTNYDMLIEKAYAELRTSPQRPVPIIENGDRVEDNLRDPNCVMLLKLHGCISRVSNANCPLILTTDQYIQYRRGRSRVFDHLIEWAFERPLIFIGHSLQDQDLRTILMEFVNLGDERPRYYAVAPDVDDIQARYWDQKRISVLKGTFQEFMSSLDRLIPVSFRAVAAPVSSQQHPILEKATAAHPSLSVTCRQFLENDVDYVKGITSVETMAPIDFYKGCCTGWSAIEQGLDVHRELEDAILSERVLIDDESHDKAMELIVIKAHAGSGKSVLLKRISWSMSREFNALCLFVRPQGQVDTAPIQELLVLCRERIYLFVDDLADHVSEIESLARHIGPEGKRLTVIGAERVNEWNIGCDTLTPLVTAEYELKYLTEAEIRKLLGLLAQHNALGTLEQASADDRIQAFKERAGRQILVALHEATLGRPFESIIEDEYSHIYPEEAKRVYLTICVLNRLNVPVRAGIVARVHGIPFVKFKERLFAPLEHVVFSYFDPLIRDYVYTARHPHIAEIVFETVLRNPEDRFDAYIKTLKALNIDYQPDRQAFQQMCRGRTLLEYFPDHQMVKQLFAVAQDAMGDQPHLFQQMAIYEMRRPGGNLKKSEELISHALLLAPSSFVILHTKSEILIRLSELANTRLEQEKYLNEATKIANTLRRTSTDTAHAFHTLAKIGLKRLETIIRETNEDESEVLVEGVVKEVERTLAEGLQQYPNDSHLLEADSDFGKLLTDTERIYDSLQKAFETNPRSTYLAIRLSRLCINKNDLPKAKKVLEAALNANPGERKLHYEYGKFLLESESNKGDNDVLLYHFQRAFTPGDRNYFAQMLYGRQLFMAGDTKGYKELFDGLRQVRADPQYKLRYFYPILEPFRGRVSTIEVSYAFFKIDNPSIHVFAHRNNIGEAAWSKLSKGSIVTFQVGFNYRGATAFNVKI